MSWLQLLINTPAEQVDAISDSLTELGALSVTWQDAADEPVYEPPLNTTPIWQTTRIVALFEEDTDPESLLLQLHAILPTDISLSYELQRLADQEWTRVWMSDFHPMCFGQRLWICPSWTPPPNPDAINILLDPGLAFGTGTHATTALCLEWLDQQGDLTGKTVIDYGCGSGILAIAAAKLGACENWAVDIDPQALLATRDNAAQNGVAATIHTCLPEAFSPLQADILLANILANPLVSLASTFAKFVKSGAPIVLSGILQEQAEMVKTAYAVYFDQLSITEKAGWVRIVGYKR
ncbi:50S ribosomal protein L11 methyltransferase [Beggiatoa leptomitoformis]|uniref:Ribosomal protein L11 methyltransferase n=1 Tax=Beggiatoa leptomitoformis TaxID=288004 RepID=A0A2N9YJ27_9GAMM|nr:50S ribosomal protein L11 methyltransferase [Beggiatoa leptomitoformis]ALG67558.1 50S ribosomal protein L11 methyltransferase [Beggiatoa leptomitoformis]AUI70216.1 50S ribosomal protein L11 methyltransferase [Beggiatoa leptomitoformis]